MAGWVAGVPAGLQEGRQVLIHRCRLLWPHPPLHPCSHRFLGMPAHLHLPPSSPLHPTLVPTWLFCREAQDLTKKGHNRGKVVLKFAA